MLYEELPKSAVHCYACQWHCRILPGKVGYCKVRKNEGGTLYTLIAGEVSSAAVDPIEKKPLFHFYPGTQVFSLGTWGCNWRCGHCQNWSIAYAEHDGHAPLVDGFRQSGGYHMSPLESVELARRHRCSGIAWTYNEPSIWFEHTYESAKVAKASGLYTVYVTNGFMTAEALDTIGPYLDAYRVDIKGFSDGFYRTVCGLPPTRDWRGILEVAERAKKKWGMHVEAVTNVIPSLNDGEDELRALAGWIAQALGPDTPWHVTRFYPHSRLSHLPPTPVATLQNARRIGMEADLRYVYLGNVPGVEGENTVCPVCGKTVIERTGYNIRIVGVAPGGKCKHCGADQNLRGFDTTEEVRASARNC